MTIVGTRPEVVRLSCIIEKLDRHCDHSLVHTGQNYDFELNEVFFQELGIRRPDVFLSAAGATAAETIGNVIIAADRALETAKPDAVLILGDTNSSLAALAAKRRRIPIFHMEAGNRCFDFRVPEETNRRVVDHVADINLPYTEIARGYLIAEGLPPDRIIKTGSPLREVIERHRSAIEGSRVIARLGLQEFRYFLVSLHREENVDDERTLRRLLRLIEHAADKYGDPVVVTTHPRTRRRIEQFGLELHSGVQLHKPFGYFDYVKLQIGARAVISDSGSITEEASVLNFPAVTLREVHERPEGFEEGVLMMVGSDPDRFEQALAVLARQPRGPDRALRMVRDYEATNVSEKVLRIILSYTDYVQRRVWSAQT